MTKKKTVTEEKVEPIDISANGMMVRIWVTPSQLVAWGDAIRTFLGVKL